MFTDGLACGRGHAGAKWCVLVLVGQRGLSQGALGCCYRQLCLACMGEARLWLCHRLGVRVAVEPLRGKA